MALIRGRRDLERLSDRDVLEYERVLKAISNKRTGKARTLSAAAKQAHTTVPTIRKWAPEVVTTDERGRATVKTADRLPRPGIHIIERGGGPRTIYTRGSRRASLASDYDRTLDKYRSGQVGPEAFRKFEGKRVGGIELESDPDRIEDLDATGKLDDFDEFYDETL
jgi:hypothetical protein